MGKESPIDRESKTARKNKRLRSSSSKYLKPGTLAHLRYNKASASKFCTDLGKKRVAVDTKKAEDDNVLMENKLIEESPLMLSPVNFYKQNGLVRTPKTPRPKNFESESRLESLPMDLLNTFIQDGKEMASVLYTYRSCVKALPQGVCWNSQFGIQKLSAETGAASIYCGFWF